MEQFTKMRPKRGLKKALASLLLILAAIPISLMLPSPQAAAASTWQIRSIDTQIISKCWNNVSKGNIDQQVSMLKSLGVNYIAIGTPYDRPVEMQKWVESIHAAGLNVWFRSHWLSWEGDEGQAKNMTSDNYLSQTYQFILNHPDFFRAGDSFTMNVEAENAGVGSDQPFGDWNAYRTFLVSEIDLANNAFAQIGLGGQVATNWLSMNGWIVENALDAATVAKMGMITVDHYSNQGFESTLVPISQLASDMSTDLDRFHSKWNVPIMIGEWGYNINGEISDEIQQQAVAAVYRVFAEKPYLYGVSYWDHMGNQTRIINDSGGVPTGFRPAAETIKNYFLNMASSGMTPTPATSSSLIADFEASLDGFDHGTFVPGYSSKQAIRFVNSANSGDGAKKNISAISFGGHTYLEFDVNLNGNILLSGDASAVYFDQGGWKSISLIKYAQNGKNGWQHIRIPLADFQLTSSTAAYLGFRFWNYNSGAYDIDNIMLTNGSISPIPASTVGSTIATFESGLDGFNTGQIIAGDQSKGALGLINPNNGSIGSSKNLSGTKVGSAMSLSLDINLHGAKLLSGDASALYFEQGGWKWISLSRYVKNGYNGWQHLIIPISDFLGLDTNSGIASIGFRFWNYTQGTYDIDNIVLQ